MAGHTILQQLVFLAGKIGANVAQLVEQLHGGLSAHSEGNAGMNPELRLTA